MRPMPVGRDPRLARGIDVASSVERIDADNVLRFRRGGKVRRSRRSPLVKWLLPSHLLLRIGATRLALLRSRGVCAPASATILESICFIPIS